MHESLSIPYKPFPLKKTVTAIKRLLGVPEVRGSIPLARFYMRVQFSWLERRYIEKSRLEKSTKRLIRNGLAAKVFDVRCRSEQPYCRIIELELQLLRWSAATLCRLLQERKMIGSPLRIMDLTGGLRQMVKSNASVGLIVSLSAEEKLIKKSFLIFQKKYDIIYM